MPIRRAMGFRGAMGRLITSSHPHIPSHVQGVIATPPSVVISNPQSVAPGSFWMADCAHLASITAMNVTMPPHVPFAQPITTWKITIAYFDAVLKIVLTA